MFRRFFEKQVSEKHCLIISRIGFSKMHTGPVDPFGGGPYIGPLGSSSSPCCFRDEPDYLYGATERFRKPEWDNVHKNHLNYEITIPGMKEPLINIHIPMDDD